MNAVRTSGVDRKPIEEEFKKHPQGAERKRLWAEAAEKRRNNPDSPFEYPIMDCYSTEVLAVGVGIRLVSRRKRIIFGTRNLFRSRWPTAQCVFEDSQLVQHPRGEVGRQMARLRNLNTKRIYEGNIQPGKPDWPVCRLLHKQSGRDWQLVHIRNETLPLGMFSTIQYHFSCWANYTTLPRSDHLKRVAFHFESSYYAYS